MSALANHGSESVVLIADDGLKGFLGAIAAALLEMGGRVCIVHLPYSSMGFVPWTSGERLASALNQIFRASDAGVDEMTLVAFGAGFEGSGIPSLVKAADTRWRVRFVPRVFRPSSRTRMRCGIHGSLELGIRADCQVHAFHSDDAAIKTPCLILN